MDKNENSGIVIMDFSGIYEEEQFWKNEKVSWVNARDISGTNCYCDGEALERLREKIADFPAGGIHFIDSGNYHYMSRIWLEKLETPFRLLVFDNHTDMQPPAFGGLLSCGGWIASALEELENLKEVVLVGPDEAAYDQVEAAMKKKVRFLSREELAVKRSGEGGVPGGTEAFFRELSGELPLYISVDKDVLSQEDASANWSQGDMTLEELKGCLETVFLHFEEMGGRIAGVDICGEQSPEEKAGSGSNDRANGVLLDVTKRGAIFEK